MSKKTDQHLLYAVVTTVLACTIIFGFAWYIFTPDNITPSSGVIQYHTGSTVIASQVHVDTGAMTITGSQVQEPRVCMMNYAPVCGVDGKTYSNDCTAGDIAIAHIGGCDAESTVKENTTISTGILTPENGTVDYTNTGKYLVYTNTNIGYTLSLPRYAYYQGMGARDGASHSLAIGLTSSGITSFDTAEIRVLFFKKLPSDYLATNADHDARTVALPSGGTIVVDTIGGDSKLLQIVDTIIASAR